MIFPSGHLNAAKRRRAVHALIVKSGAVGLSAQQVADALDIPYSTARQYLMDLLHDQLVTKHTRLNIDGKGRIHRTVWTAAG